MLTRSALGLALLAACSKPENPENREPPDITPTTGDVAPDETGQPPAEPTDRCTSGLGLGYGEAPYGGSWASLHRDGRNSDWADCEVADVPYAHTWTTTAPTHLHFVKPVIGPRGRAWLAVTSVAGAAYLYGVDLATGSVAVALGAEAGLNGTVNYGQPVIDPDGNVYLGQNVAPPPGTPCVTAGGANPAAVPCGEYVSFDTDGNERWRVPIDGAPISSQLTNDGKIVFQTWRGSLYVLEPAVDAPNRTLFAGNPFPDAAATLGSEPGLCVATGEGSACIAANTIAVHPETGAIYNTIQGFVLGRPDTFVQRFLYDPTDHAISLDADLRVPRSQLVVPHGGGELGALPAEDEAVARDLDPAGGAPAAVRETEDERRDDLGAVHGQEGGGGHEDLDVDGVAALPAARGVPTPPDPSIRAGGGSAPRALRQHAQARSLRYRTVTIPEERARAHGHRTVTLTVRRYREVTKQAVRWAPRVAQGSRGPRGRPCAGARSSVIRSGHHGGTQGVRGRPLAWILQACGCRERRTCARLPPKGAESGAEMIRRVREVRILLLDEDVAQRSRYRRSIADVFPNATFGEAATLRQTADLMRLARWDAVVVSPSLFAAGARDPVAHICQSNPNVPLVIAHGPDLRHPATPEELVGAVRAVLGATPG